MWSAIRSDLKEFVSSVADDGNTVLTKIDNSIKDLDKDDESNLDDSGDGSRGLDSTQLVAGDDFNGSSTSYDATGIISEPSDEAARRMGLEETYIVPLLKNELNGVEQQKDNADTETKSTHSPRPKSDEEEEKQDLEVDPDKISLVEDEDNDYDESDEDIKLFLKSFDIEAHTEEISKILTKHPNVGLLFENLVPVVVTYAQFWQRYFYRCDVQRIKREWEEEEERARIERKEMIDKGVKSVKNMFGGALKAFKGVSDQKLEPKKASIYEKYQAEVEEQQRAIVDGGMTNTNNSDMQEKKGISLGFFRNGRPPFALNTAGSGDEDEEYIVEGTDDDEEEEGDEEEDDELGWESDEEEDESDEETDDNLSGINNESLETEIVFGSPTSNPSDGSVELKKLREELSQVVNERDKLQATLDNQVKPSSQDSTDYHGEIERLKMSLFEKDSKLAALKASLQDACEENTGDGESHAVIEKHDKDIDLMKAKISAKDNELNRIRLEFDELASAKKLVDARLEVETSALKEANEQVKVLSIELEDSKRMAMRQSAKLEEQNKVIDAANSTNRELQEAQLSSEQTIKELTARAEKYESSREELLKLKAELDKTRAKLKQQEADFTFRMAVAEKNKTRDEETRVVTAAGSLSSQPSSSSSVVEVAPQQVEQHLDSDINAIEDVDDWGDAWSDGDD